MNEFGQVVSRRGESVLATNKVIRNTYILLSATLLFSAAMAALSVAVAISPGMSMGATLVGIGLLWFVLPRFENSAGGVAVVFAFTGLMGLGLGPFLAYNLALPNGPQLVATALGGTGAIFLALSGYAMTSRRDFSFMGGFLFVGLIVVIIAMIANIFLAIPAMSLAISAAVVLLMSGMILFDTSRIIHGGETNYIRATVNLYLDVYNLFIHLLNLLAAFSNNR